AMVRGGKTARSVAIYGWALLGSAALFLVITKPFSEWFTIDLLGYSIVYVSFTAGIAVCLGGIWLISLARVEWARYAVGATLAVVTGFFFLSSFPALLTGPYGAMNPDLAKVMFDSITEAIPITRSAKSAIEVFLRLIWPLMGLAAAIIF